MIKTNNFKLGIALNEGRNDEIGSGRSEVPDRDVVFVGSIDV